MPRNPPCGIVCSQYALIVLRRGGYPCVVAADGCGAEYRDVGQDGGEHDVVVHSHSRMIDRFPEIHPAATPAATRMTAIADEHGWGAFPCAPCTMSVWAPEDGR